MREMDTNFCVKRIPSGAEFNDAIQLLLDPEDDE